MATQPLRVPVERRLALKLLLDAGANDAQPEAPRRRRRDRRTAALRPVQHQRVRPQLPSEANSSRFRRQRAVLGGIGGELVQRQRQPLRGRRLQRNIRPLDDDLVSGAIGRKLLADQRGEVGAIPARIGQQRMGARQRFDAAFNRRNVIVDALCPCQPDDRLNDSERIAGPVIDFARQQILPLFGLLAIGHVDGHAADAHDPAGRIDARRRGAGAPARLAVRPQHAELGVLGLGALRHARDGLFERRANRPDG